MAKWLEPVGSQHKLRIFNFYSQNSLMMSLIVMCAPPNYCLNHSVTDIGAKNTI